MEYIFEILLELVLEGSVEVSKSRKVPKYIRYPLIVLIALFFIAVLGLIFFGGILALKKNVLVGIALILLGSLLLIMSVIKFRKTYLTRENKE